MSVRQPSGPQSDRPIQNDRIVVVGGSDQTLVLLRVATIRSEDIVLIGASLNDAVLRFAARFAIETRRRDAQNSDVQEAASLLVSTGDVEAENMIVRAARQSGVPVFVSDRTLVSDFTLIEFLEQRPFTAMAA